MLKIKFNTPHVNRMTKEILIGKPLYKEGVLTGHVTDAVRVEIDGQPFWEVTAQADLELDTAGPVQFKARFPESNDFSMPPSEPGQAEHLIPSKVPSSLLDPNVVMFLLRNRSEEFLEKLDYEKIRQRCEAGALHVLKSSLYIDQRNGTIDFTGVVGRVLGVGRVDNGLVVYVRLNKDQQLLDTDPQKARAEYAMASNPEVRVRLAWAGHVSNSETFPYTTGCFYLTTEALIQPM